MGKNARAAISDIEINPRYQTPALRLTMTSMPVSLADAIEAPPVQSGSATRASCGYSKSQVG
jgi:hypothetical protein